MLSSAATTSVKTIKAGLTGSRISWRATTSISARSPSSLLRRRRLLLFLHRAIGNLLIRVNDQHLLVVAHARKRFAHDTGEEKCSVAFDVHDLGNGEPGRIDAVDAGGDK